MASEYRQYSDFPAKALPERSWADLSRLMSDTAIGIAAVKTFIVLVRAFTIDALVRAFTFNAKA